MANFNEKTGYIEISDEEKEVIREHSLNVDEIINYIIWGNKKEYYE